PEASMRESVRRQHPQLRAAADDALPVLSFRDAAFDAVVANFVLNHVDDPRAGAAELLRVARSVVLATVWTASPSSLWGGRDRTRRSHARTGCSTAPAQRLRAHRVRIRAD